MFLTAVERHFTAVEQSRSTDVRRRCFTVSDRHWIVPDSHVSKTAVPEKTIYARGPADGCVPAEPVQVGGSGRCPPAKTEWTGCSFLIFPGSDLPRFWLGLLSCANPGSSAA